MLWQASDKALLIPQSLEVLGLGVGFRGRWRCIRSQGFWTGAAIALDDVGGCGGIFWPKQGGKQAVGRQGEEAATGWNEFGARWWIFVVFTIWPLGFLFLYLQRADAAVCGGAI